MGVILAFAEQRDGALRRASLEVVSEARRLARGCGATVESVLIGSGAHLPAQLASYGADRVHVFSDPALATYATEPYARALADVIADVKPLAVLIPFTSMGKDLAPRVAARVGAGLASDCVALDLVDGRLIGRRPLYGGRAFATVKWSGEPQMATLRPGAFALEAGEAGLAAEIVSRTTDPTAQSRVTGTRQARTGRLDLTEAERVVSGGRGLTAPEHFQLIKELAEALGAAVGASRAMVDAEWVDHQYQVGQTGKTVSPRLYVAVGISGAVQHLAGMSSSRIVVAINKAPDAPIFRAATYGIVGDLFEVVPRLTAALKAAAASRG